MIARVVILVLCGITGSLATASQPPGQVDGWPQLQYDAQHTGYSPESLNASQGFKVGWRVDLLAFDPPEHVYRTVQIVAADNHLYVPTLEGNLYALDPATGKTVWRLACGEGIAHTPGAEGGRVFCATLLGSVLAIDAKNGQQVWRWNSGRRTGFSSAVLLADGKIFVTGRGGDVHALRQSDGEELWHYEVDAPIFQTAAYRAGRVYFAAEDMHCYCLAATDGKLLWKSSKLSGMSFNNYYPLVYGGLVILESQMAGHGGRGKTGTGPPLAWGQQKEWLARHGPSVAKGQPDPEALAEILRCQDRQVESLRSSPEARLRFCLDEKTGQEACVLPHCLQSMSVLQPPPVVDRDGMLTMPVTFLTCGWGRMDLKRQRVVDLLYDGTSAGRGNGDEDMALSAAGSLVFAVHWVEGNAQYTGVFNLDTRRWTALPRGVPSWGYRRGPGHNAQYGTNAASIAYGAVYHHAFNTVHNWVPVAK